MIVARVGKEQLSRLVGRGDLNPLEGLNLVSNPSDPDATASNAFLSF